MWIGMNIFHGIDMEHKHKNNSSSSCTDDVLALNELEQHEDICSTDHIPLTLTHFEILPLLTNPVIRNTHKSPIQSAFKSNFELNKDRAPPVMM